MEENKRNKKSHITHHTSNNSGITLIALIITIIVLLILAVVAIREVTGDGIIHYAKNAAKQSEIASEMEKIDLSYKNAQIENLGSTVTISGLRSSLKKSGETNANIVKASAEGDMKVRLKSGNKYLVDKNGNVTYLGETEQEENVELTDVYVYLGTSTADGAKTLIFSNQNQDIIDGYTDITSYENIKDIVFEKPSDRPWNNDISIVTSVDIVDKIVPSSCSGWFYKLENLTNIKKLNNLNTSQVTTMARMFDTCSSLSSLAVSSFDTSNVTDMSYMFNNCSNLNSLDVSSFNTENVTTMYYMFRRCSNLSSLDVSSFDTSKVTTMMGMFYECNNLTTLDVSSFNTENVTTMAGMFSGYAKDMQLKEIKGLENFNTSNVITMKAMFQKCSNLSSLDLSNFDTSKVTDMTNMFYRCSKLSNLDLTSFNTKNVTTMASMFKGNTKLTEIKADSNKWVMAEDTTDMFTGCGVSSLTYINNE